MTSSKELSVLTPTQNVNELPMEHIGYIDDDTGIKFPVKWAMPSHETFNIIPIKKFIKMNYALANDKQFEEIPILDLFPHPYQRDALETLKLISDNSQKFILYDPIYSDRQHDEMYSIKGTNYKSHPKYFQKLELELMRIAAVGCIVLKFGWNGKRIPGFKKFTGLVVEHGGQHNATICTGHKKNQMTL